MSHACGVLPAGSRSAVFGEREAAGPFRIPSRKDGSKKVFGYAVNSALPVITSLSLWRMRELPG
jgi:hypothetical protein